MIIIRVSDIALRRLKELRDELDRFDASRQDSAKLQDWRLSVQTALIKIFEEKSPYLANFRNISWTPGIAFGKVSLSEFDEAFQHGLVQAKSVLDSAISSAEYYSDEEPAPRAKSNENGVSGQSTLQQSDPRDAAPDNVLQAIFRIVWLLPLAARIAFVVVLAILIATAALFATLPDRVKETVVAVLLPKPKPTVTATLAPGKSLIQAAATGISVAHKFDVSLTNALTNEYSGTFDLSIDNRGLSLVKVSWVRVDLYIGRWAPNVTSDELMTQFNAPPNEVRPSKQPGPIMWLHQTSFGYVHPEEIDYNFRSDVTYKLGGPARYISPGESFNFPIPILVRAPRDRWVGVVATLGLNKAVSGPGVFLSKDWKDLRTAKQSSP